MSGGKELGQYSLLLGAQLLLTPYFWQAPVLLKVIYVSQCFDMLIYLLTSP